MTASTARKWLLPVQDRNGSRDIARAFGIPQVIAQLLYARGIRSVDDAEVFLNPLDQPLSDPFSLTDMERAVERIRRAREQNESVRVYGDYDVDGIAGTALLTRALHRFGIQNVTHDIPDRIRDGYGLNPAAVQRANDENVQLIITVDNGVTAFDAAAQARKLDVDLIITDHHKIDRELPPAIAVINPKRDDPQSPFANACGAAVALKLATALNGTVTDLGLAALATIADVVPLTRENRVLVALGLAEIARAPIPGIRALARRARIDTQTLHAETVAFQLSPRINAAGRLGNPRTAIDLLLAQENGEADRLAAILEETNEERRAREAVIFDEASLLAQKQLDAEMQSLVLWHRDWHPGLIGIAASKLQAKYNRPIVMIAIGDDNVGRASARSTSGFDLVAALRSCDALLERYGGHRAAAGMTLPADNIPQFAKQFQDHAKEVLGTGLNVPTLNVDANIAFTHIDRGFINDIARLEPFGHENPAPVFGSNGVEILPDSIRVLRGGHVRCAFRNDAKTFTAIGFGMAEAFESIDESKSVDIAYSPKINHWNGQTTIQLHLIDVRPT